MVFKRVERLDIRAKTGGRWNVEKLAEDLAKLEIGCYEVSIDEFMAEYYAGDWKTLKHPVLRAVGTLKRVINENELNITVIGSPKNGKIGLTVNGPKNAKNAQ